MSDPEAPGFEVLVDYLKRTRGFDFNAYKRASLMRRIQKRMQSVNVEAFTDYTDYLEVHPEEFEQLFNVILINVTSFFRDDLPWTFLRESVIPAWINSDVRHVRIWSAGCASGEETYSLAMLVAEAMGREDFRDRVKIYATDVDEQALNQARAASYTERQVAPVPQPLVEKYFTREGDRFVFDQDLRRSVIFGRHDLIQDAPISRVNLLTCRNTLMYFNTEAQVRILVRFHFALLPEGVLFLGKSEMLLTHAQLFAPLDLRRRVFRKVARDNWRERMAILNQASGDNGFDPTTANEHLYPAAFDASPHAQIVIDGNGLLALFNDLARTLFSLAPSDLGRPVQDLELSYRPLELRSPMAQAVDHRKPVVVRDVHWDGPAREPRYYDVHVAPVGNSTPHPMGVSVAFVDVSRVQDLQLQLTRSKQDLETAYEELQSTNEELETANEELQSTVEELETTNEELQSTNEELRDRSVDLNRVNSFFESILAGVRSGVVVLDEELRVVAWNHRAEDLWGLRAQEVHGQYFLNLDIGLPTGDLRPAIRSCLAGDADYREVVIAATNRRGKPIVCKVTVTPLLSESKNVRGTIVMMDEQAAVH